MARSNNDGRRLNTIAVVFEYEADADGNTRSKTWEWK